MIRYWSLVAGFVGAGALIAYGVLLGKPWTPADESVQHLSGFELSTHKMPDGTRCVVAVRGGSVALACDFTFVEEEDE